MAIAAVSLVVLGLASGPAGILAGGAIFGIAFGMAQPTLMALVVDRVSTAAQGKAVGTFSAAWELGLAAGAARPGWLLNSIDFGTLFLVAAAPPIAGAFLALRARASRREAI